jgi:hypothetical protein
MKPALLLFPLLSLTLLGQATRTWVSGVGDDANPCSRTAPCKTFAGAISKTAAGGEISALDPGGFGAVTINKSITLNGTGTIGSIVFSGVNGITVNAGANDTVVLRNLSLHGITSGLNGINYIAGGSLIVDRCDIQSATGNGINVNLTNSGSLTVRNSTISRTAAGIRINSTTGTVTASISNTTITGATNGVHASYGNVDIFNSTVTNTTGPAVLADATAKIFSASSLIANSATGVRAANTASVLLSNNDVVDNGIGFSCADTGTIRTAGNNRKADNLGGSNECQPSATISVQ